MSWGEAKKIAEQRHREKLARTGKDCPKCGHRNFAHDPLCRSCYHIVRPGMTVALAAIVILALLSVLLVGVLR